MSQPPFPGLGGSPGGFGASGFPGLNGQSPASGPWDLGTPPHAPSSAPRDRTGPPIALLTAAALVPLSTVPLLFLDGWWWSVLGWAVATFGSASLLIVATVQDTRQRASAWYFGNEAVVQLLRLSAVLLALGMAAAHAWLFADWVSRLEEFTS